MMEELQESVYWAIPQKGAAERNKDDNPTTRVSALWLHQACNTLRMKEV